MKGQHVVGVRPLPAANRLRVQSGAASNGETRNAKNAISSEMSKRKWASLFVGALLVFLFALPICAQQLPTATILGDVKDSSGAIVPGAKVTVRNVDTGLVRTQTTGGAGEYRVDALPVGNYEVRAEASGFETISQTGIVLVVSQEAVINFALKVGSTQQVVEVTAEAPQINTTNGQLGALVNEHAMADLPLNGRNYVDLALMQPGTSQDYNMNPLAGGGGKAFSNNGSTPWSNYFTLDGAPVNNALAYSSALGGGNETLGVDGIQEFKIVTIQDATYGLVMGGQMVMVSKGGTNRFHGDVYDYLRNDVLDARNFFDYSYLTTGARIPQLQRNDFGASFGGPIKKDKTFFYAVYEGLRQEQGQSIIDNVPNANCHGPANAVIWNGSGTQPAGSIGPCPQLEANPSGAGTNSVTIAPVMAPLLALYPNPNLSGNRFTYPVADPTNADFGQIRVDQNFSPSDSGFVRYTIVNGSDIQSGSTTAGGSGFPQFQYSLPARDQFLSIAENHTFSSTLLNSARISASRATLAFLLDDPDGPFIGPQYSFNQGLPVGQIAVTGLSQNGFMQAKPTINDLNTYTLSDDVFYTKGRHSIKFGTLINRWYQYADTNGGALGDMTFGNGLASFMEGLPSQYFALTPPAGQAVFTNPLGPNVKRDFTYDTFGFYVQDDWRTTSRLTLNLGLRYEFETAPVQTNGQSYAIRNILTDENPTPGPLLRDPTYHDFSPRVGFAYDLFGNGKTSVRGGFGIYYDIGNLGGDLRESEQGTPPLDLKSTVNGTTKTITLPFTYPVGALGTSLQTIDYNDQSPYAEEFNLTIEQQLPFGTTLTVSYVGLHGIHLWTRGEGNPVIPTSITDGAPYYAATINACQGVVPSCRVNHFWTSDTYDYTGGYSHYNAIEATVSKRLSRGLEFVGSYTFSRSLDAIQNQGGFEQSGSGCVNNPDTLSQRYAYGPSCFDTPNKFNLNLLYHLPNMKGNGFLTKFTNGWWVGNIVTIQSGNPYTPILGANRSRSGVQGSNPDYVNVNTAASIAANPCTSLPGQPAAGSNPCAYTPIPYNPNTVVTGNPNQWFNPAMFSLGPEGYLGDAEKDMLRGPRLGDWDFSAVKDTKVRFLGEGGNLEFRAEFFNILNRANFALPNGTVFGGGASFVGPYSEAASSTAGQVTTTLNTSRQIQFALKLLF